MSANRQETGLPKGASGIVDGLKNAPDAFIGLLEGKNFGKLVVNFTPD